MFKTDKGHRNYLRNRKRNLLIRSGILLAGIAGLFLLGWLNFHKTLNWLSIVAVLSAIPMAMMLATLFSMLKYKGRPEEEYSEVKAIAGDGLLDVEIVISQRDKFESLEFPYVYIHETGLYFYTPSLKMDMVKTPDYIRNFLRLNSCDGNVHIYNNLENYKKQLKKLPPEDRASVPDLLLQQEGVVRAISM